MDYDSGIADSPGKIRPAQLITTFGPGALHQTEYDSVMIMGSNFWKNTDLYIRKNHVYLEKITRRSHFKMPYYKADATSINKRNIACISYPQWGYCTQCNELQRHRSSPGSADRFKCRRHDKALLPARLVCVCKRGHVGEFPWVEWAHSNPFDPKPICDNPRLTWHSGDRSSSISDSSVRCSSCNAWHNLHRAFDKDGIKLIDKDKNEYTYQCKGESPWLNKQEQCRKIKDGADSSTETEIPVGMLARSSSLYYPKIIRGIIIPHLAHPIAQLLQTDGYRGFESLPWWRGLSDMEKAEQLLGSNNKQWKFLRNYSKEDIVHFMRKLKDTEKKFQLETEEDLREIEYEDLLNNDNPRGDQGDEIRVTEADLPEGASTCFDNVKKLDILTAIEISRYFTRLRPPGEINSDSYKTHKKYVCNIETRGKTKSGKMYEKNEWLPCVIKKGEGIFITFKQEFIDECLNQDGIKARLSAILANYRDWEKNSGWPGPENIDKQFILLHSLSHILIKVLSRSSGYSEASIFERIYSSSKMRGILIYTTDAGDGSLGGLVRQAPDIFSLLKDALQKARSCSRDPICIAEDPGRMAENGIPPHLRQNGSACYGCIMLPETSCEYFNKLLDRRILVDKEYGVRIN